MFFNTERELIKKYPDWKETGTHVLLQVVAFNIWEKEKDSSLFFGEQIIVKH